MKKLFAIAFTCVYLLLTVGVNIKTHHCMGRINPSPLNQEEANNPSHATSTEKKFKNSAEFFILNEFQAEAFVVFLA